MAYCAMNEVHVTINGVQTSICSRRQKMRLNFGDGPVLPERSPGGRFFLAPEKKLWYDILNFVPIL